MRVEYKNFDFYLFGSYLTNYSEYNDIDCLIVVSSENELKYALDWVNSFKKAKIHFTIYTQQELHDKRNKFSIFGEKKLLKINFDEYFNDFTNDFNNIK